MRLACIVGNIERHENINRKKNDIFIKNKKNIIKNTDFENHELKKNSFAKIL